MSIGGAAKSQKMGLSEKISQVGFFASKLLLLNLLELEKKPGQAVKVVFQFFFLISFETLPIRFSVLKRQHKKLIRCDRLNEISMG